MKPFQLFQKPMLLLSFLLVYALGFSQVTEQWVKRYNGPGHGNDRASKIVVNALGNVYITGTSNEDYATIKYDATGKELWVKRYNGPGNDYDQPAALAVDALGNVYVTGYGGGSGTFEDYVTIKYDTAGNELWVKQYNGPNDASDFAASLAVDASGNVYVTGESGSEYATIKYDAAGNELWVKRSNSGNVARSLAIDASGNVYVTGNSIRYVGDEESEVDYTTIKYDVAGNELWIKRHNGSQNSYDLATSLAVDDSGNVYVAGLTAIIKYDAGGNERWVKSGAITSLTVDASGSVYVTERRLDSNYFSDYATIKYDTAGNELWVKRYNGPENGYDDAASLVVDASGNVYVTGSSGGDYATIKYDANGAQLWVKRYNSLGNGNDYANSLAVDATGNVYVTGGGDPIGYEPDYVTIKYSATGSELWIKRYSGPGNLWDIATDIAVDASGNAYVTGWSYNSNYSIDYATIKYDAAGNELWVKRYNGPGDGHDYASSLAVDASGNVYVTGSSWGGNDHYDFATIKYDADGAEVWIKRYSARKGGNDAAYSLAVDGSGNVYVTGSSQGGNFVEHYTTIKYNAAGNQLWVRRYDGPASGGDVAYSVAVDVSGNVYVTGESYSSRTSQDYATIKYDAAGNELWVRRYNGYGKSDDKATSLVLDASGNVYVTGGSGDRFAVDYATVKYDAAGNELWIKRYKGPENGDDIATALAVDASGNVYVTGESYDSNYYNSDYATIKYDASGNELWVKRHESGGATSLAVDASGNVYVTGGKGNVYVIEGSGDYVTIKYDAAGNELWLKRYNGPGNGLDGAAKLAVDALGNVYVTGGSYSHETGIDYTTIKYSQTQPSVVSSFTLVNADSDEDITELHEGDTLNLVALATLNLNIRANTTPDTVGSMVFNLSGAEMRNHTENIAPYALFADNNKGDYYAWTPINGNYTLTATPYSESKGKGEKGTPLTIHFTVTGTAVSSLILVNAETDQDIKTLQNGDVIDLSTLPTTKLNIRAVVHPDTVGSVVFNLNNRITVRENLAPYAIGGDIKGDYRAWTLPTGHYNLTATPYNGKYGRGKKGKAHSVSFTVVDMAAITRTGKAGKPIADAKDIRQTLKATPNPFSGQTTVSFSVPKSGYTTLQVYDTKGVAVEHLYQAQAEAGKTYIVAFDSKQLRSGVYVLRLATGKQVQSYKLVLIR